MNASKRSTLWTIDGKRIGEIAEDRGNGDDSEYVLRILTNLRGKQLIREALIRGQGLIVRGPDRPPLRERDKRDDD